MSYGFVRNRGGVPQAVKKAKNLRSHYPWVFKSDITSFFDEIDREILKADLLRRLGKSSIIPILHSAIDCEIDRRNGMIAAEIAQTKVREGSGLRQGMPLSPILSNFVLRRFDRHFHLRKSRLIRYADDFVFLAKSRAECESLYSQAKEQLEKQKLQIPAPGGQSKTIICSPEERVEFLGFEISPKLNRNDYEVLAPERAFESIKEKLREFSDLDKVILHHKKFSNAVTNINSIVNGFVNVYKPASNFDQLRVHAANCRANAFRKLLGGIFGDDAIRRLDQRKLRFLEMSDLLSAKSRP